MASPANIDLQRSLRLLKEIRYLYGQYLNFFLPVSLPCRKLGATLLSLTNGISRFAYKYDIAKEPRAVFCQLTLGLSDALVNLKSGLVSCSRCFASDTMAGEEWSRALDSVWIEHNLRLLSHTSTMIEIINETMESSVNPFVQLTKPLTN